MVSAILEEYSESLDEIGRSYLKRIREASGRMDQLITGLLTLAKTSRSEMIFEQVDLSAIAQEVGSQLRATSPERNVTLMIAPNLVADGDRVLLRSVLENLLGNAWKFSSRQPNARIEFGTKRTEGEVVYFVKDNGAGFDMRYVNKLFETFQRLHDRSDFPGTGVGLAIVQRIIQRHGGRIWAESTEGQGATFYFVLSQQVSSRVRSEISRLEPGDAEV